ncbi:MAG: ribonuclease P protein component 4 [Nanoarchaeota archaeon]|nr:ribonuclease P [Nanoarchaeota archaeon]MBU1030083.1 ribonuclease P [Nanoarchaeota archaeon]MBU1849955.1 ribonuclease P [Nanoarchaeota archaeon]
MAKSNYRRKQSVHVKIAKDRINHLFSRADIIFNSDESLSDRYVFIARRIAMKFKVKLGSVFKRKFCHNCYKYFRPGVNCSVRLHDKRLVYRCFNCKHIMRFPYKK